MGAGDLGFTVGQQVKSRQAKSPSSPGRAVWEEGPGTAVPFILVMIYKAIVQVYKGATLAS